MKVYIIYKEKICVALAGLLEKKYSVLKPCARKNKAGETKITYPLWNKWRSNAKNCGAVTRTGGHGRTSLIEFAYLPEKYRVDIINEYGDPDETINPLRQHFKIDGEARRYYSNHPHNFLPEQVTRFTVNYSTMKAVIALKEERMSMRRRMGNSTRGVLESVINDLKNFKRDTKEVCGLPHTLPVSNRLKGKIRAYKKQKFDAFIDMRGGAKSSQKTTPEMIQLWNDLFASLNHKPDKYEVYTMYNSFLEGKREIVNTTEGHGEIYNPKEAYFVPVSASTIGNYLRKWENASVNDSKRNGDRQKHMGSYRPWHKMKQPPFSGELISVDDRQPPFWCSKNRDRLWVYGGIDVGSQCFTSIVFGESKKGIILEFYRQMVRNYAEWNMPLPYELEAELNLNDSYTDSFLQPGAMFDEVRIEANNARAKRIENYWRQLRHGAEKKREGWLARPHALYEANQPSPGKIKILKKTEIMQNCLQDVENWNNAPHNLYPEMTRWQFHKERIAPELKGRSINWRDILPGLGYLRKSSMNVGRIILNGTHHVVGLNGSVALGDDLLNIMRRIEGREVIIYFLDDNEGKMLKAHVHDPVTGRFVCELMGDLSYYRSKLSRKRYNDNENRALMSAYERTVTGYINSQGKEISRLATRSLEITPEPGPDDFRIPGLHRSDEQQQDDKAEVLYDPNEEDQEDYLEPAYNEDQNEFNPSLKDIL